MAEKKRVLIVTQEIKPYTSESDMSDVLNQYAQFLQNSDMEVRILMPRFGVINERRHRLHEVVRLSGMNISIDDEDYPLIIKVASLPGTRMQVYFLDNEEFFKRKFIFNDEEGTLFEDNIDRMLFFTKGVVETVKKFGWAPDIVHANGWMMSLLPASLKTVYAEEPIFQNAKFVYTSFPCDDLNESMSSNFEAKLTNNGFGDLVQPYVTDGALNLNKGAMHFADGTMSGKEDESLDTDQLNTFNFESEFTEKCVEFFSNLTVEAE